MTLTEQNLLDLGFSQHIMSYDKSFIEFGDVKYINPKYYYKRGRLGINATGVWTWFLDGEQRNDVAVPSVRDLENLIKDLEAVRYQFIADYPNNPWLEIGCILTQTITDHFKYINENGREMNTRIKNIDNYPHLFKKL